MATYPCTLCGQRIAGEAVNVYLQGYSGGNRVAFNHKVHDVCVQELVESWIGRALHKDADGFWNLPDPDEILDALWTAVDEAQTVFRPRNGSR